MDANLAPVYVGDDAQFDGDAAYDRCPAIYDRRRTGGHTPEQVERSEGRPPR